MKVKHKFLNVLLVVCMVFCLAPATVFAENNVPDNVWTNHAATGFAGGVGSETDPYQIATAEQVAKLSKDVSEGINYQGKFFKLTDNIDLSRHRWVPIGIYKWESSGETINKSFQGFMDGNNKTISGLIVDERTDKNAAGFFGNILNMYGGTVGAKNLTISNANIYADEDGLEDLKAGILAGSATANEGKQVVFENITVSGAVEVKSTYGCTNVGGMIGYGSRVKATDCKANNISVTGASNSGGFTGVDVGSVYENCEVSGTVSGTWALGGFVGYTSSATTQDPATQSVFKKSAADVKITGSDWRLGGFAGYAEYGQFDNCVAFENVTSTVNEWEPKIGGFIGQSDNANVNCCHVAGKVTSISSDYKAGGFVGNYVGGTFLDCSFDSDKNSGLSAAGTGTISSGVEADNHNNVWDNICKDYYGGHSLIKIETKEATCIEEGYDAYWTCKICKKLFSDEAGEIEIDKPPMRSKIDHTYGDKLKFDETGHWKPTTCGHDSEEGALDIQAHTFGDWVTVTEATEDAEGLKECGCLCGYKVTAAIEKLAHTTHVKDKGTRVAPTCEKKGSITYKCTKCGKVMEVVELDATGHKWDAGKVTKEPTETKEGVKTYTCSVCGKTKTEVIPKKKVTAPKKGDVIKDDKGAAKYEILHTTKKEAAYKGPANKKAKTVTIPATVKIKGVTYKVTKIADNAFKGNKTVTKITIGSNVRSVGKNAFYGATKLSKVSVGKNVTEIGANAFYGCASLTSVTIPGKVTRIGANAFYGCKKLKTIIIKSTKLTSKTVSKNAFKGLTKATTIKVPKKKLNTYKKLFKSKGLSSKVKVKGY